MIYVSMLVFDIQYESPWLLASLFFHLSLIVKYHWDFSDFSWSVYIGKNHRKIILLLLISHSVIIIIAFLNWLSFAFAFPIVMGIMLASNTLSLRQFYVKDE